MKERLRDPVHLTLITRDVLAGCPVSRNGPEALNVHIDNAHA